MTKPGKLHFIGAFKRSITTLSFVIPLFATGLAKGDESASATTVHAQDDAYWARLAQDYPPFQAPAARLAARNEDINGVWGPVIDWPHIPVSAANLPDGRILTWASNQRTGFPQGTEFTYASTWDPASNSFQEINHNSHDMFCAHVAVLEDGRVMANGGTNHTKNVSTFDFRTNTWQLVEPMNNGRWYPTTVAMPDGKVFTAIGSSGGQYPELWTEGNGWKSLTGASLQSPILSLSTNYEHNWWPLLHVDPRGKIFHSGPTPKMHVIDTSGLGKVTQVGPLIDDWYPKHGATVMYDEGKILTVGGATSGSNQASTNRAMTIDINGSTPIVAEIAPMAHKRKFQSAVMLPTGEVLIVGGNSSGTKFNDLGSKLPAEIWNPQTGQWRTIASMSVPRNYHSIALLMNDGRVLAAGGGLCGGCAANHQDAQILSPPYLFNSNGSLKPRPTISQAPDIIQNGQTFTVQSEDGIQKFTMIKMSATTHALSTDLRYLEVPHQRAGTGLYQLTANGNRNVLTPGHWMLFAISSDNVPSVAAVVRVTSSGTPIITQPLNQVSSSGDQVLYSISAIDPDGQTLSFSATGLPAGLSINSSTGVISGTAATIGTSTVTINVSDGSSTSSVSFDWSVFAPGSRPGVSWEYYEGDWNLLPDFDQLTPVKTGTSDGFDLSPRNRNDYYGFRFSARIDIPVTGSYTFYTTSDDGSQLFIDGNMVVNNDGLHGMLEKSGTVSLSAGEHLMVVTFFEKAGGDNLVVEYSGGGQNRQIIPSTRLLQNPLYNVDPILADPGNQQNALNTSVSLALNASDLNGDTLSYSATGLPTGLSINSNSGLISGTASQAGQFNTTIRVRDGNGGSQSQNFIWTIIGPITINPIQVSPQQTSTSVSYVANTSGGANVRYRWNFGDGGNTTAWSSNPEITHVFTQAGTPIVTLQVSNNGNTTDITNYQFTQPVHNPLSNRRPAVSMSMAYEKRPAGDRIWVVNPDNDTVSILNATNNNKIGEVAVGNSPRAVAIAPDGRIWITNKLDATITVIDPGTLNETRQISLPRGSQPHGLVFSPTEDYAYVALEALGQVHKLHPTAGTKISGIGAGSNPRHLSIEANGAVLYASQFITSTLPGESTASVQTQTGSTLHGGEVHWITTSGSMSRINSMVLRHSERQDAEHSGRGIPNYVGPLVISPDGLSGWVPSKQDNIKRGMLRDGRQLTHDSTVRSISSRITLSNHLEDYPARIDHDNGGIATTGSFGPNGIFLFVALEGSRQVAIINNFDKSEVARIQVGRAPQGILTSPDGSKLYTHNFMDRSVSVHDISAVTNRASIRFPELATVDLVANESLGATVLKGKQLFYDAQDPRVAREQYVSCASCHNDGMDDGRVWDMTGFGEGLRNTISLEGRGGMAHGMLHWSANFDEVQDFEGQIRDLAGGIGLMSNSDFFAGDRETPLGTSKAGLSADLDAMAAYVASLSDFRASPWKSPSGGLSSIAIAGQQVFQAEGCASCHSGEHFTDSGPDNLHDIGTLTASSGQRLNAALAGIDTPTLKGVWSTAPYLHDGSAADITAAIQAHSGVSLSNAVLNQLQTFVREIDGSVANTNPDGNTVGGTELTVDGDLNDWAGASYLPLDPDDTSGISNRIDYLNAGLAHTDSDFYVAIQNRNPIEANSTSGSYLRWGWQIAIDVDQNTGTGYQGFGNLGVDYLIEGSNIQAYAGSGNDWNWNSIGIAESAYQGSTAELRIPRALIGDPGLLRIMFRGANQAYSGDVIDHYPDDQNSYFEYSLPGGSNQQNARPVANAASYLVSANSTVSVSLSGSDPDNDPLSFEVTRAPENGRLDGSPPALIYTPNAGYSGADSFDFIARDDSLSSTAATIRLTVSNDQGGVVSNSIDGESRTPDGDASDWAATRRFAEDPSDMSGINNRIDWRSVAMAHDTQFVHLLYESYQNVGTDAVGSYLPWGWQLYIDTDLDADTGFKVGTIGADYILEGQAIHRYIGLGDNWNWQTVGSAEAGYNGRIAELKFPRSLIGNPGAARMVLRGLNQSIGGDGTDLYPDTQEDSTSSEQFFKYEFSSGAYNGILPQAGSQSLTVNSGSTLAITLDGSDPQGQALSFTVIDNPQHGTLSGDAPDLIYTPVVGYEGNDYFTFNTTSIIGTSVPATVSIQVNSATQGALSNPLSNALQIDGNSNDWNGLSPFIDDPQDMTAAADTMDWQNVTMAHNSDTLYVLYRNRGPVNTSTNSGEYIPWGWQTYIDSDSNPATGFKVGDIGADYLIEATQLVRYAGTNNAWNWQVVESLPLVYRSDLVETSLPIASIGNPAEINVLFVANNRAVGGTERDIYPDNAENAGAENNYFTYRMSNIQAQSANRPVAGTRDVETRPELAIRIALQVDDIDGDTVAIRVIDQPQNGTLRTGDDNEVIYTPNPGFSGDDNFSYVANDGTFDSSVARVGVSVEDGNVVTDSSAINVPDSAGNDTGASDESGGGSLAWHVLMLLALLRLYSYRLRRH